MFMKKFCVLFSVLFVFSATSPAFAVDGPLGLLWRLTGVEKPDAGAEPVNPIGLNGEEIDPYTGATESDDLNEKSTAVLAIMLLCAIPVYIIGAMFSKKTRCVIVFGWIDFILTLLPMAAFIASDFILVSKGGLLFLNILFCVSVLATLAISVLSNLRYSGVPNGIIYAVISVVTKVGMMMIAPLLLLLLFGSFFAGTPAKKDRRYKTGWRPRRDSALYLIILTLATFMVYSVMKKPDDMTMDDNVFDDEAE
jgi:hypothetical protein